MEPLWGWFSLPLRKLSTSMTTGSWAYMKSLTLSSLRSPITSPRANSELSLTMTVSENGVWSRRGFLKARNWFHDCLSSWSMSSMLLPPIPGNTSTIAISETIRKNRDSHIQVDVDTLVNRTTADKFQLNGSKCKELRINFSTKNSTSSDSFVVNGMPIDLVTSAKIRHAYWISYQCQNTRLR